jgi:hypothetical protein
MVTHEIPYFDAQFEDIHLYINYLIISEVDGIVIEFFPEASPYCNVWHDMSVTGFPSNKDLVGKITLHFRNQGKDQQFGLFMDMNLRVRANGDTKAADTFCKAIQYLFDWVAYWAKENDIRDTSNEPFVIPVFTYSQAHFEAALPE